MENLVKPIAGSISWKKSCLGVALAVACFHAAYSSLAFPVAGFFILGYAFFLIGLTDQPNVRRAFYIGLAAGYLCYAPQLFFMWHIFGPLAPVLWLVLAFWIGLFLAISCACIRRWGKLKALWLVPIVWTGVEYFRSELYYLKFSWLNLGYALPAPCSGFGMGMYGIGFLIFAIIVTCRYWQMVILNRLRICILLLLLLLSVSSLLPRMLAHQSTGTHLSLVGIQLEFPPAGILPKVLNQALARNTNAQIFVLSEYTLNGAVPDTLKSWCRDNRKFLVVGGEDFVTNDVYYNTAFVVGTNGEIVFKQAKSVPIQFFRDGLPASKQELWSSPWGKIGICICYDLSYPRVTDELVRQGAQLLIVPTMDVAGWGRHQHELHARVAPVRASEHGIPIFRLASSGISQAVQGDGTVVAKTRMGGNADVLAACLQIPRCGSLPVDRLLASFCAGGTGLLLIGLLCAEWKGRRRSAPVPDD